MLPFVSCPWCSPDRIDALYPFIHLNFGQLVSLAKC